MVKGGEEQREVEMDRSLCSLLSLRGNLTSDYKGSQPSHPEHPATSIKLEAAYAYNVFPTSQWTTVSESGLFDHLINVWEFKPGLVPGTCDLYFLVDFKFQSPLYRQVATMFFKEVVSRLVGSFSDRCHIIYGPPVPVLENTYGQGQGR
ncbi:hypothetical protein GUJ93_ZPchr0007g5586 [Zizania palustris]|uniref:Coenzyme Q-binding protein COQ10 START domain-containing protein n=1 Tax=Zizania palustris TaxID=103762 RepID=A0A8J5T2Z0_ZIZPA|nr:hypothetical protein GUJ93_ZPchr0007g5586 [Zizania palustris]